VNIGYDHLADSAAVAGLPASGTGNFNLSF